MVKRDYSLAEITEKIADMWLPLNEEQRQLVANTLTIHHYKKNECIYREGETPTHLLCLLSGKVKTYKDGVGGRSQIVRVYKPVEYFSYRAHFAGTNLMTGAAAFEPSVICKIPLTVINQLLSENLQLAHFFIQKLAKSLGVADSRMVSLTQKHIRGRLAEAILFLKDRYGLEQDHSTLSIYLSREDLANLSNMTTSNAIRTLSAFATEKIIAIDGRKIKIIDEKKLEKISVEGG